MKSFNRFIIIANSINIIIMNINNLIRNISIYKFHYYLLFSIYLLFQLFYSPSLSP